MNKILFLGTQGFLYGMAEVEKQTLIARALQEQGCDITFICNKSFNYESIIPFMGEFKGIKYIYTNLTSKRCRNKLLNKVLWQIGSIIEKFYLLFANFDFAIVNSRNYKEIELYAKLIHFRKRKIFLTHVEDFRSMHPNANKNKLKEIIDFEKKTWKIIDGAFPISEELFRQVRLSNTNLPLLKVPVLVDINDALIAKDDNPIEENYFMFCGSADYVDTVKFIIDGFECSNSNSKLLLVLGGSKSNLDILNYRINQSFFKEGIIVKSTLSKEQLWGYYKNALCLLIPLNFDQRDKARFPHKIGEYCAVGKPIITSNWGEIPTYFYNNENSILLESNDSLELGNAMRKIEENSELREKIGRNAFDLAINEFDYRLYGEKISKFINN